VEDLARNRVHLNLAFAGDAPHFHRTGTEAVDITVVFASPIST
jgi:hypothetical protein